MTLFFLFILLLWKSYIGRAKSAEELEKPSKLSEQRYDLQQTQYKWGRWNLHAKSEPNFREIHDSVGQICPTIIILQGYSQLAKQQNSPIRNERGLRDFAVELQKCVRLFMTWSGTNGWSSWILRWKNFSWVKSTAASFRKNEPTFTASEAELGIFRGVQEAITKRDATWPKQHALPCCWCIIHRN